MLNREFQKLNGLYLSSKNEEDRASYLQQLRNNLKQRNGSASEYVASYTFKGNAYNIDDCDYNALREIDGDMNPQGH